MQTEEERVHKVPRKQSGSVRESKQSTYRRAEISKRTLLSTENRLRFVFDVNIGDGLYFTYCFGFVAMD